MEVIEIKGAKQFINKICLDNPHLSGIDRYIFRGQANAKWTAIPSAFRRPNMKPYFNTKEVTNRTQIENEFNILNAFIRELNSNGFHIPNEELLNLDSDLQTSTKFQTEIGRGEKVWPPKRYHSIIAIAQHHGIPTRFLDFTYDPFVALYFAVTDALNFIEKKDISIEHIAVYAVNTNAVTNYDFILRSDKDGLYKRKKKNNIYQLVQSPSSFNQNLKAQKGLFLAYIEKSFYSNDIFKPCSLEDYLTRESSNSFFMPPKNYKFITKASNAKKILQLLHNRFYTASTIFPSIEGCVKSLDEKRFIL